MKRNSKKHNNYFDNVEINQRTREKKNQFNYNLLKTNQIPIAGKHSILSAVQNKNRKLHYLITTKENYSLWIEETSNLVIF